MNFLMLRYVAVCSLMAPETPYTFDKEMLIKMLNEEKAKIRHKLEGYAELLKEASIDGIVKSIHAESPGEGIVKAVQEIDAALVVVGCRGLGRLRRTLMGSVSDYVLHHVHIPVLICRHQHDAHHKQHK
ncbi:Y1388-like protein [Mya arenaria]|uniref:Y1388-like protein n=1 Tax=Mya arenaria TaxID=6604 RepID=A0ABY7FSR1_MYAAR|nr:Y1388-like protein [Mya arenaria]